MKIKLDNGAFMPERAHPSDAGLDLKSIEDATISPKGFMTLRTGVHCEIPQGCVGLLTSKSGIMARSGVTSRGTIDSGYTGEIKVTLFNHSYEPFIVRKGDKVSQLVVIPILTPDIEVVDKLEDTERGDNGFGSTGR